jgi:DNA-binding transcriptional regulator YdaS (Cro superfamily)
MDLKEYLNSKNSKAHSSTQADRYETFARDVGVSVHTVYKWVNGTRRITDRYKIEIERVTKGKITIEDMVRA